jgi:hypothetical protein
MLEGEVVLRMLKSTRKEGQEVGDQGQACAGKEAEECASDRDFGRRGDRFGRLNTPGPNCSPEHGLKNGRGELDKVGCEESADVFSGLVFKAGGWVDEEGAGGRCVRTVENGEEDEKMIAGWQVAKDV